MELIGLPDDILCRIIHNVLASDILHFSSSTVFQKCSTLCALSAVSRRFHNLVFSILNDCNISLQQLPYDHCHHHNYIRRHRHQKNVERTKNIRYDYRCEQCFKAFDPFVQAAIHTWSSVRTETLCVVPTCLHDTLAVLRLASVRFGMLRSLTMENPFHSDISAIVQETNLHGVNFQVGVTDATNHLATMPNLIHLTWPYTDLTFLKAMDSSSFLPALRSLKISLTSIAMLPALTAMLSDSPRANTLTSICCSLPISGNNQGHAYAAEYFECSNHSTLSNRTELLLATNFKSLPSQLVIHFLQNLSASFVSVSTVQTSLKDVIDHPDRSFACAHCALDKNVNSSNAGTREQNSVRNMLYSRNLIDPPFLDGNDQCNTTFRTCFSTTLTYPDVLATILPNNVAVQCTLASENAARSVRPPPTLFCHNDDDYGVNPLVATSLRNLLHRFPPYYDQLSDRTQMPSLKIIDIATTTFERDPYMNISHPVIRTLHSGEAGELDCALNAVGKTLRSVRLRPFPRAWYQEQDADKSLALRILHNVPKVRVFDVYVCVLTSFLHRSQLSSLFTHMPNLRLLHVSEQSLPAVSHTTLIAQPSVAISLRTIPPLLASLAKFCPALQVLLWHATHSCRLPCSGCHGRTEIVSLSSSFGSPLGHALHALQRYNQKCSSVNTVSLQLCLESLIIKK